MVLIWDFPMPPWASPMALALRQGRDPCARFPPLGHGVILHWGADSEGLAEGGAMRVTLLLGGDLRREAGDGSRERGVDLPEGSLVQGLLATISLPRRRVRLILVNGKGATLGTRLHEGDRVALFPPELSFNTFVSLSFRTEGVEARTGEGLGGA